MTPDKAHRDLRYNGVTLSWSCCSLGAVQNAVLILYLTPTQTYDAEGTSPVAPRVMLLCGADMLESFLAPGVWRPDHLRTILGDDHGVVCIAR